MNELYEQILDAIKDRSDWETRQSALYQIRHQGLRRRNKPYPGAPDMHFPLVDASIDKHKPFLVQQIYATETAASFIAKEPQYAEKQTDVAQWFDYKLKHESNFEREAISGFDGVSQNGGCPVKCFWKCDENGNNGVLEFDSVDPLHVIVPKWTEELQTADLLTHVIPMSVAQYRRNKLFKQDEDFIKRIKGRGGDKTEDASGKDQKKEVREGLTCGRNDEEIIVWEIYTRDPSDFCKVIVKTRSPICFDEPIRADFRMSYNQGVFKDGWFPFVKWRAEIKDKGYYSPRGLAETLAPFEQALSKSWNFSYEWMDFFARPMFEQTSDTPANTNNFKTVPGAVVPNGLKPFQPPAIPMDLREDMNFLRESAEYRVQTPDYGVLAQTGGKRTAHEIAAIQTQQGSGIDLKARVIRLDLRDTYRMAWALLLQFGKDSPLYMANGTSQQIDPALICDCYVVTPAGSSDSWDSNAKRAKAWNRFEKLQRNPYVDQGELVKDVLSVDEAGITQRLYTDPGITAKKQDEDQAMECLLMQSGYGPEVLPADDDKAHLQNLAHFAQDKIARGQMTPELARLCMDHGMKHQQQLIQKKDPMAKQIAQQLAPLAQLLGQMAQADQPQNILQMQAQGGNGPALQSSHIASASPGPAPSSQSDDPVGDATKVGNMLVNMAKAGVPVSPADFNKVLIELNLPPLVIQQPISQPQPQLETQQNIAI
jgi:hypothetical protein